MAPPSGRDPAQKSTRPPSVAGTPAPTRPPAKETPVPVPKPGAMPSFPDPNPAPQATPDAPSVPNDTPALAPAPAPGVPAFSVLAPADANLQDVTNAPYQDGRIRNPIPSKLKGKTDGSKGNFSVMHMDVGKGEATERDAQAKRTSESTALAAQRAYENGYVALRRSRFVHVPGEPVDEPPQPPPVPTPYVPPPAPAASTAVSTRRSTLNAAETKAEQARLLTLLRSLHPVLVVDQMCKALAFFGGIPGAPPPADGCFPQSAEANGPGSLFVGWVAEIFPKLGGNTSQREPSPVRQLDGPVKRGRGRPKGSKATKARKDKGIKKGPLKRPPAVSEPPPPQPPPPPMQGDESWVDVDETVMGGPAEEDANVLSLAQATTPSPPRQVPALEGASQQGAGQELINQATNAVNQAALLGNDADSWRPAVPRKVGRPKGSKNRPKLPVEANGENGNSLATPSQVPQPDHATRPASSAHQMTGAVRMDGLPASVPPTATLPAPTKKRNQIKGATRRQLPGGVVEPPRPRETPVPIPVPIAATGPNARPAYAQPVAPQQPKPQPSPVSSEAPMQPSPGLYATNVGQGNTPLAAQKRKRKGGKDEALPSGGPAQAHGLNPANQASTHKVASTTGISASQPSPAAASHPPPAKRQKKAQDVKSLPEQSNAYFAAAPAATSAPVADMDAPSLAPPSRPASTQNPVPSRVPEPAQRQPSPSPVAMASPESPHHGHFEVQSPTMENYEAQLQAQLEQQSEPVPQPVSTQNHASPVQVTPARIQQQQPHFTQRQQQQQQQQMSAQTRSPKPQVSQSKSSQSASPMMAQQQTRSVQTPYSQYRAGNNQYSQQHQSQPQQQQSYASSQSQPAQSLSPFAAPQQAAQASAQPAQKQQYTPKPQQPYTSSQQSYSTSQQYSNNQHQLASQQRYQQQLSGSTSTNTASYTAHHSPQFNPSTNPAFTPADSSYRPPAQPRNVASYSSQRGQSSTPTTASAYRTTNGSSNSTGQQQQQQALATHTTSSFAPNTSSTQQRPATTTNQGMQGMANSFAAGGNAADWNLFDTGSLDNGQGGLGGMNNGSYSMGGSTGVRASSNAGARFSSSTMGYETSGLPYGQ